MMPEMAFGREEMPANVFSPLCLPLGQYFIGIRVMYHFSMLSNAKRVKHQGV